MKYGIADTDWEKVFVTLSHFPNIQRAILFGSRAKGNHKPFSDVDIALIGKSISINDLLELKNEIDDLLLPYEFDFCVYKDLKNSDLKSHIDRRGIEVYRTKSQAVSNNFIFEAKRQDDNKKVYTF